MEKNMENSVMAVMQNMVKAQNDRDIIGLLRLVHRESPAYAPTQQVMMKVFENYRLKSNLSNVSIIGVDDEYAYIRACIQSVKIDDSDYRNNLTQTLVILRRCNNEWLIWMQVVISVMINE
jgi:hypothetical protein